MDVWYLVHCQEEYHEDTQDPVMGQYLDTVSMKQFNKLIVKAICEADRKGVKAVSLGLLNLAQIEHEWKWAASSAKVPKDGTKTGGRYLPGRNCHLFFSARECCWSGLLEVLTFISWCVLTDRQQRQ